MGDENQRRSNKAPRQKTENRLQHDTPAIKHTILEHRKKSKGTKSTCRHREPQGLPHGLAHFCHAWNKKPWPGLQKGPHGNTERASSKLCVG